MSDQSIRLTSQGEVATLTIVSKKGSMGPVFWREMAEALPQLGSARALIIRGEELFSAGLDVKSSAQSIGESLGNLEKFRAQVAPMHTAFEGIASLPIPVIAAVHGWCIGAGTELISACDIRLCSADARFSLPEVRLGIAADLGGLQRLPGIVGQGWARQLALTGEPIDAARAERIGLVTEVLDTPELLFERAEQLAAHLATLPPKALEGTKKVLNAALPHAESLSQAVDWNAQHMTAEGLAAAFRK
ncbi:enoyl-CoA hydratase-related protein [Deinococcus rubellus]|uniref:Enoyl-CoA hydratase-related protein n=1 Tax=Deinococcus rubellus TaxID=1889240 RepID=A0ABY5YGW6_9DEIO|nr:enoyl-CoA hydratase-related protein [Deinococcus rubellus]UWX64335.1 enoyl-CoA hydratase-related protein [Deinococcus rubellus]